MKEYTKTDPVFSPKIVLPEVTDPGHAGIINNAPMQLLQNTLCNQREIKQLKKNMGAGDTNEYSTEVKYHTGEYCLYNNMLYRCLKDTQGEWNVECWVQTNPMVEIMNLRDSLDSLMGLFEKDEEGNLRHLGAAAFAGIANNDTTTEGGFLWDARRGKALRDDVDALNSALGIDLPKDSYVFVFKTSLISFKDAAGVSTSDTVIGTLDVLNASIANYNSGMVHVFNTNQNYPVMLIKLGESGNAGYFGIAWKYNTDTSNLPVFFVFYGKKYSLFMPQKIG